MAQAYIDEKYIVHCKCGTTFVHYYTRGNKRKKCDKCLQDKKNQWFKEHNKKLKKDRRVVTCSRCEKERYIGYVRFRQIETGVKSNLCKSCSMKKDVVADKKVPVVCPQCNEERMVSKSTESRIRNGVTTLCKPCSALNRRIPDSIRSRKRESKSKKLDRESKIKLKAKIIKERESKRVRIDEDATIFQKQSMRGEITDDMKKMQEEFIAKKGITEIKPKTVSDGYDTGLKIHVQGL